LRNPKKRFRSIIYEQKYLSFGIKIVKISLVDAEIIGLQEIIKNVCRAG